MGGEVGRILGKMGQANHDQNILHEKITLDNKKNVILKYD